MLYCNVTKVLAVLMVLASCEGPAEPGPRPVEISIDQDSMAVIRGERRAIAYSVLDEEGKRLSDPVVFTSENTQVATVDESGWVQAHDVGRTRIKLEVLRADSSAVPAILNVTVTPRWILTLIPDSIVMVRGSTATLEARIVHVHGSSEVGLGTTFSVGDSTMITLESPRGFTAGLRARGRYVSAQRSGRTAIIARFENAADTAMVVVVDP